MKKISLRCVFYSCCWIWAAVATLLQAQTAAYTIIEADTALYADTWVLPSQFCPPPAVINFASIQPDSIQAFWNPVAGATQYALNISSNGVPVGSFMPSTPEFNFGVPPAWQGEDLTFCVLSQCPNVIEYPSTFYCDTYSNPLCPDPDSLWTNYAQAGNEEILQWTAVPQAESYTVEISVDDVPSGTFSTSNAAYTYPLPTVTGTMDTVEYCVSSDCEAGGTTSKAAGSGTCLKTIHVYGVATVEPIYGILTLPPPDLCSSPCTYIKDTTPGNNYGRVYSRTEACACTGNPNYLQCMANAARYILHNSVNCSSPPLKTDAGNMSVYKNLQISPNPFEQTVTFSFYVEEEQQQVQLQIFSPLGAVEFVNGTVFGAGAQHLVWNSADVASGVYYYRLQTGATISKGKLIKR